MLCIICLSNIYLLTNDSWRPSVYKIGIPIIVFATKKGKSMKNKRLEEDQNAAKKMMPCINEGKEPLNYIIKIGSTDRKIYTSFPQTTS